MYQILTIYLFIDKLIKTKFLFMALATLKHSVDQVDFQDPMLLPSSAGIKDVRHHVQLLFV